MSNKQINFYLFSIFFSTVIMELYWNGGISYFYMNNFGLNAAYQMGAWTVFSIFSILTSALCGKFSDRNTRVRNSRRIPYIKSLGALYGIVFTIAFIPWHPNNAQLLLAARLLIVLCLLDFSCSFVTTCLFAIPSEELCHTEKRSNIYAITSFIQFIGSMLCAFIFPSFIPEKGDSITPYCIVMIGIGVTAAILFFNADKILPSAYRADKKAIRNTSFLKSLNQCLKNKAFLIGEIYLTTTIIASAFLQFSAFYYINEVLYDKKLMPLCFLTLGILGGICFVYSYYYKQRNKLAINRICGFVGIISGFCLVITFLLQLSSNPSLVPVAGLLGGFGVGISFIIQYFFNEILLVNFVDMDETTSSIRKEGEYYGLDSLFDCVSFIAQPITVAILFHMGYDESITTGLQGALAKTGILICIFFIPATFMFLGSISIFLFYPKKQQ